VKWHKVSITYNGETTVIHDGSSAQSKVRIIGGKIKQAINSISTFEFSIYPNNPGYTDIHGLTTEIKVYTDEKTIFVGRVLTVSEGMDADGGIVKSVLCEDRLGWLCDTVQPYLEWDLSNGIRNRLEQILARHNARTTSKRILLGVVTVEATNSYNYVSNWETTLETISQKLIANYGGEIQLREQNGNLYLDYLQRIGSGTDTAIELAVNLKTISSDIDETSIITRLYPLGAKLEDSENRVQINVNGNNYIQDTELMQKYGVQEGVKIWDDVTLPSNLLAKATAYMQSANKLKKQYKITALDLAQAGYEDFEIFALGNIYHIKNPIMSIDEDLRIIGIVYDIDKPYESALTFGEKFETISGFTINKTRSLQQDITSDNVRSYSLMDSKIDNATALITGAQGGHVILYPSEQPERILIMDTADVNTATSCLQLNKKGLGFWIKGDTNTTPLNGRYTNAWTIDGNLVASFITALTLTGQRINNGNGTFQVNANGTVIAKALQILGGSIDIETSDETTDVIRLSHNEWTIEISPLEMKLTNSTIGGNFVIQAGMAVWKWNDENKLIISSSTGNINTYTDNGKSVFYLDTNNRALTMYNSNGDRTVFIDSEIGAVYAKSFIRIT
jgi:phage minor structural protein